MDELQDMGLTLIESDNPDRSKYDFSIADEEDNIAWVWGDDHDVEFECSHPHELIEFDDDETQGRCELCGCFCDWHYEESSDDGCTIKERIPHEWYPRRTVGGVIAKCLEEMRERNG